MIVLHSALAAVGGVRDTLVAPAEALSVGGQATGSWTPAMEAGIADHVWSIEEIVELLGT